MNKPEDMSDTQLSLCVEEYCKRVHRRGRVDGYSGQIMLTVTAYAFTPDEKFIISHNITVGPYDNEVRIKCENALSGIDRALSRLAEDKLYEPKKVTIALPAPTEVEYAEFAPVVQDDDDDMPY